MHRVLPVCWGTIYSVKYSSNFLATTPHTLHMIHLMCQDWRPPEFVIHLASPGRCYLGILNIRDNVTINIITQHWYKHLTSTLLGILIQTSMENEKWLCDERESQYECRGSLSLVQSWCCINYRNNISVCPCHRHSRYVRERERQRVPISSCHRYITV